MDEVATGDYITAMLTVGIKELKNKLSTYVRAAASGETVLVTDRGTIVAELVPPRSERNMPETSEAERKMAELVRSGIATPAKLRPDAPLPPRQPAIMTQEEFLRDLAAGRGDQ